MIHAAMNHADAFRTDSPPDDILRRTLRDNLEKSVPVYQGDRLFHEIYIGGKHGIGLPVYGISEKMGNHDQQWLREIEGSKERDLVDIFHHEIIIMFPVKPPQERRRGEIECLACPRPNNSYTPVFILPAPARKTGSNQGNIIPACGETLKNLGEVHFGAPRHGIRPVHPVDEENLHNDSE
jgi:hypothetical protein